MALRFRRSFTIAPGLRVNLSKTGVSVSGGVPGATINVRDGKVTRTVGLPGTGISDRSVVDLTSAERASRAMDAPASPLAVGIVLAFAIPIIAGCIYGTYLMVSGTAPAWLVEIVRLIPG